MWKAATPAEWQDDAKAMWDDLTGSPTNIDTKSRLENLFPKSHVKEAKASDDLAKKLIAGGATLGAGVVGTDAYLKSRKNKKGFTKREIAIAERKAGEAVARKMGKKGKGRLKKALQELSDKKEKFLSDNPAAAAASGAALGAAAGGYAVNRRLKLVREARKL